MKKLFLLVAILFATVLLVACSSKPKLVLYIPNSYIDKDVVKTFEREKGVKVKILTFDSNEVALGQIKSNSYDLVIPSDYAIEELATLNLIDELDYKEILGAGFEFTPQLVSFLDELKEEGFDFLKYAVPYFWGSFGILYNKNTVTREKIEEAGFSIIGDQKLETIIYDSSRDAFMAAMLINNDLLHDNERTDTELNAAIIKAETWLKNAKGAKTSILSDEILTDMLVGTKYDAVMTYSGDAAYIMSENDNYRYFLPENTNVWADGFVIPKNSKNKELAIEFIKFMSSYDAVLQNSIEQAYSAIRKDVMEELISLDGDYGEEHLKYAYDPQVPIFQTFRYDNKVKNAIDFAWRRVKVYK